MHPNEQVLRDADKAQLAGDIDAFIDAFTDDVIVHIPGRSALAGDYRGKEQFGEVFAKFNEKAPNYTFEPHAYFADDEHGVILQTSNYGEPSGLVMNDALVCHFRDGKISEFWFVGVDPYEVDELLG